MTELPSEFLEGKSRLEARYLGEADPIRQSGFGGGPKRWRIERDLILEAVPAGGDFLDIGCANGYLLECLVSWARKSNTHLIPYGVDIGAALINLARRRLPQYADHFWAANAWEWTPPRRFDFVYTLYDCVPQELLPDYIHRLLEFYVASGGTLIVGAYGSYSRNEAARDVAADIAAAGFCVAGTSERGDLPVARVAWTKVSNTC